MKAKIGDRLVLEGIHIGDDRRVGTIIEIAHPDGTPPYRVRWPNGHESFISPGPDARIQPTEPATDANRAITAWAQSPRLASGGPTHAGRG